MTSVSWNERGNQVAVGTHHGYVTVWDVSVNKQVSNDFILISPFFSPKVSELEKKTFSALNWVDRRGHGQNSEFK